MGPRMRPTPCLCPTSTHLAASATFSTRRVRFCLFLSATAFHGSVCHLSLNDMTFGDLYLIALRTEESESSQRWSIPTLFTVHHATELSFERLSRQARSDNALILITSLSPISFSSTHLGGNTITVVMNTARNCYLVDLDVWPALQQFLHGRLTRSLPHGQGSSMRRTSPDQQTLAGFGQDHPFHRAE
jgi:hypothetical protein